MTVASILISAHVPERPDKDYRKAKLFSRSVVLLLSKSVSHGFAIRTWRSSVIPSSPTSPDNNAISMKEAACSAYDKSHHAVNDIFLRVVNDS